MKLKKRYKFLLALVTAYLVLTNLPYIYNNDKVADYVTSNAAPRSRTMCAWYCMRALQSGGCPVGIVPAYAYSKILPQMGFQEVSMSGYRPQKGDVCVLPTNNHSSFGHIAIYNGVQWVSDFKQKDIYPSRAYRERGESRVFRNADGFHWAHVWTTPVDWFQWMQSLIKGRKKIKF